MEVDISSHFKALRTIFSNFRNNINDDTIKGMERELDVLISFINHEGEKSLKNFSQHKMLYADSLSILLSILNETNIRPAIYSKTMKLLFCLGASCEMRKSLQNTFKLTTTLVGFLRRNSGTNEKPIISECLQLLQRVTYGIQISSPLREIEDLIKFLVTDILSIQSETTLISLGILANICRNNVAVQDYIKGMSNMKALFRSIASFLPHDNWMAIIYSLSILSICLDQPLGEKIFNQKNIDQTFRLVFNVLLKGDENETIKYSCDLLTDLLVSSRMQKYLAAYSDLQSHLKDIFCLLKVTASESSEKILELLVTVCDIPILQNTVVRMLFYSEPKDSIDHNVADNDADSLCLSIIKGLITQSNQSNKTLLALELIRKSFGILYSSDFPEINKQSQMASTLPTLYSFFNLNEEEDDPMNLKQIFGNIQKCTEVLLLFCQHENHMECVSDHLNISSLSELVLDCYKRFGSSMKHRNISTQDYREEISAVVIGIIQIIVLIEPYLETETEEDLLLSSVLQSQHLLPFLANCLCSESRDLIQSSMEIINRARDKPEFSTTALYDAIAFNNKWRAGDLHQQSSLFPMQRPDNAHLKMRAQIYTPEVRLHLSTEEKDVAALADQISSGLEIRDGPKVSEIMDLYEHKLAIIETKESHLQDLLDAKTAALAQADRLLAENRCRKAQSEAECMKLRCLLMECQKTSEEQSEKIKTYVEELRDLTEKAESTDAENIKLKAIEAEHEHLKSSFEVQLERLETAEKNLAAAEEEQNTLSEMNEMLRSHVDNLKNQYECSQQQLKDLDKEKQDITTRLKEKERKYEEVIKHLIVMEDNLKEQDEEKKILENKIDQAEQRLKTTEKIKDELCQQIETITKENKALMDVVEEHEQLKTSHEHQNQRLETTRRSLEVANTENKSLSELNSVLGKQLDNLKIKHDSAQQLMKELEKEKINILHKMKESEKNKEEALKKLTAMAKDMETNAGEKKAFEKKLKSVEKILRQTEKAKSDLSHKVSSLGLLNQKYEKDIEEKDGTIKALKTEIDKHSQIAAMIHNLSSGKIPTNNLNFSS